jgi:LmbE family N-acetylglucosaminyl deacetylase
MTMAPEHRPYPKALCAVFVALLLAFPAAVLMGAQQDEANASLDSELARVPLPDPEVYALPLPEDRGRAQLEQTLKGLGTTASVLYIVAHPDDEDGALLTYLSRGLGARVTLFTLTRGEGGQNAMSAEENDALGLIRTNELLKADEYYGVKQLWGTEADFGFSKTQEEAFSQWGHQRVLYDAVLAVRKVRPQIIVATFVGGITDGHGQHQVSGEIAQEAFKDAGDPKIFPEQLKDGLEPWQPFAVYSRTPFARIDNGRMFDYATGKWAPAKFHNYVTGAWTTGALSTDVTVPVGTWDPALGRTYVQIAREGWGEQKSQNGGANPALSGMADSEYHLWGAVEPSEASGNGAVAESSLFRDHQVDIDTSLEGLAHLVPGGAPEWLSDGLHDIETGIHAFQSSYHDQNGEADARQLAPVYRQMLDLYTRVKASSLDPQAKAGLELELGAKIDEFQTAFKDLLGLEMIAFTTKARGAENGVSERGDSADESPRSVVPGEEFRVRVHTAAASQGVRVAKTSFVTNDGPSQSDASWTAGVPTTAQSEGTTDAVYPLRVPENAEPTEPYFTRPTVEQPYYDISNPKWRERSFAPFPLTAWVEFNFDGLPIRLGKVVQTLERQTGPGGIYEPLVITPAIGLDIEPQARILPLNGSALPVLVTVHTLAAADGTVQLKLPVGWRSTPAETSFHLAGAGETAPLEFSVNPSNAGPGAYSIDAVAQVGQRSYRAGWHNVSYAGLQSYNQYLAAELKTRKVDVKMAPELRVGYVMGTGDLVPQAIQELGVTPHLLAAPELESADLSAWNVIVIGIRAYTNRPELSGVEPRLEQYVKQGGTLVIQYQSATFPAPLPLAMGRVPERVVDEHSTVKLLDAADPLLNWPNKITTADFDGWIEERGHSFMNSWDPAYTALTETADPGQEPQRGGLLVAHPGKGTYIYVSYALYRQFPELVPGAYRLLANLLSAGMEPAHGVDRAQTQSK